jgi:hypothetical protein
MVKRFRNNRGSLMVEMMAALGILTATLIPLAYTFVREQRTCRAYYWRAAAMEIVDGEMEVLAAGQWRSFKEGTHAYPVTLDAARNLPAGRFTLIVRERQLRLEWKPDKPASGGPVIREAVGR